MTADRAAYLQDAHHEDRRQGERRVCPAVGEFALQERGKLLAENERLRAALRAASKTNPRNLPCPTCQRPNMLTPADRALGYQCDRCADHAEGLGPNGAGEY